MTFNALWVTKPGDSVSVEIKSLDDDQLMPGDVTVAVEYSTVNYKDGLAVTGRAPVVRTYPMIPGIDLAGVVETSSHAEFKVGDRVVLNGWALSQTHFGGLAQRARVRGDWLIKLPDEFTTRQAMAIGTAGYTAMLSVLALEHGGVTPDRGDVLVTGASGGVGSIAIMLLSRLGYRVVASTGRPAESDYLRTLGAAEIMDRTVLSAPGKPLASAKWAGAVDSVGGTTLVNVLAQTRYRGTVTSCGLVQSADLPGASVFPFIHRNVTLSGIDSVEAPQDVRQRAWSRLARDLDVEKLTQAVHEVSLQDVPAVASSILSGQVRGRTVVNVNA